jgi:hypothetical protein
MVGGRGTVTMAGPVAGTMEEVDGDDDDAKEVGAEG